MLLEKQNKSQSKKNKAAYSACSLRRKPFVWSTHQWVFQIWSDSQWRPPNVCKYFFLFSFSFFCYELNSNLTTMAAIVRAHEQHGPLARPRKIKTGLKGKVVTQSLWTCTCMVDWVLRHWQLETARANTGSLTSLSQKHARRGFFVTHSCLLLVCRWVIYWLIYIGLLVFCTC